MLKSANRLISLIGKEETQSKHIDDEDGKLGRASVMLNAKQ